MDKNEKYTYWEEHAQYDLDTAGAMLDGGRYLYAAFMCQQAIEKLIKGLYLLVTGEEPVKTHNITFIFNNLILNDKFKTCHSDENFIRNKEEFSPLFIKLLAFYICARYPDYKEKISKSLSKLEAETICKKTVEAFEWLKSLKAFI